MARPVIRLLSFGAAAYLAGACTGDVGSSLPPGLTPAQQKAQKAWTEKALPAFKAATCTMCHDGSMPDIGYLVGTSDLLIRDTAIAFLPQVVNLSAPQSSRVLNKGVHTGPALLVNQATDILDWITAERDARPPGAVIETPMTVPMPCVSGNPGDATCPINVVDLSALGSMGSSFNFVATALGPDLYVTDMKFKAGPDGLHIEHPLFETWPPMAAGSADAGSMMPASVPDPIDRYFASIINLAAAGTMPLGNGITTFSGFKITDPLSIRFDVVDKVRP
ncbi:MAG: hypothetical protein JWO36_3913 [Myxococcales bacterium]|nr:hypothetical protein [Myxococcales bacterium]